MAEWNCISCPNCGWEPSSKLKTVCWLQENKGKHAKVQSMCRNHAGSRRRTRRGKSDGIGQRYRFLRQSSLNWVQQKSHLTLKKKKKKGTNAQSFTVGIQATCPLLPSVACRNTENSTTFVSVNPKSRKPSSVQSHGHNSSGGSEKSDDEENAQNCRIRAVVKKWISVFVVF